MERTSRVTTCGGESPSQPITVDAGIPRSMAREGSPVSTDELFETMVIGTLASDSGTHFPIMASRVKRSTLS